MSIDNLLINWIKYDLQLKENNKICKNIRDKKNDLEHNIINYLVQNKLTDSTFRITDINTSIEYTKVKEYENITCKYLEKSLQNFFKNNSIKNKTDEEIINEILQYIKTNRNINEKEILKKKKI